MLSRRDLLKILLGSAMAATLDVEKLLWIPKPIITVPEILNFTSQYLDEPNQYVIGYQVFKALKNHPDMVDLLKWSPK